MSSDQSILKNRLVRMTLVLIVPVAVLGYLISEVCPFVYHQYALEKEYQATYGESWQEQYENNTGPLTEHRTKAAVGLGGMIIACGLAFGIYRVVTPAAASSTGKRRKRRRSSRRDRPDMPPARRAYPVAR